MPKDTKATTKKRKELQEKFLESLAAKGNITLACKAVNINRCTYYRWLKNDKFENKVNEIAESLVDFAESQLLLLMKAQNPTAIIFFLKTKGKSRGYSETHEITGNISLANIIKKLDEQ